MFSFRRYIIGNTILFALFSMACAFARDLPSMIAMRGLQGFAGGVLIPMAFTIVNLRFLKSRNFGIGVLVNILMGFALFGTVFILPQYLGQVQRYNAEQLLLLSAVWALPCGHSHGFQS